MVPDKQRRFGAILCGIERGRPARCVAALAALSATPVPGRQAMTQFNDRERAFESKFAHDEEMKFRLVARRNRLLGEWAARKMGLSDAETQSYAKDVVRADFEEAGDGDVIRKVLGDLTAAGVETSEAEIHQTLDYKTVEAKRQLMEALGGGS
jgi:hypothetical protein